MLVIRNTHPLLEGPALADFMLVVVEHFLARLDHLVPHVLDLRHSLGDETQRPEHRIEGANILSRLMSSYAKGLRHHEFDRNSTVCTPSESALAGAGTVAFRHEPVPLLAQVPDWMPTWTLRFSLAANGKTPLQTCTRVQDQTPLPYLCHVWKPADERRRSYLGGIRQVLRTRRELLARSVVSAGLVSVSQLHSQLHELLLRQEVLGVVALDVLFEPEQRATVFKQCEPQASEADISSDAHFWKCCEYSWVGIQRMRS